MSPSTVSVPQPMPTLRSNLNDEPSATGTASAAPIGMRVVIEGQPAMVVPSHQLRRRELVSEPPRPTFEPRMAQAASVPVRQETATAESNQSSRAPRRIQAQVAAHQTVAESYQEQPTERELVMGESVAVEHQAAFTVNAAARIIEFSAEDPTVCKLIRTGENTLSLIGLRPGATRIAMVLDAGESGQTLELRSVQVRGGQVDRAGLPSLARDISRTVSELYPQSQLEIVPRDGQLIVQGRVSREADARKILNLVRKTSLLPVVDQLKATQR